MWRNFFSVALRNIGKNRIFSIINIAGLAFGLASAILIILFIAYEVSFDRFNEKADHLYRAYIDGQMGGQEFRGAWTSYAMAPGFAGEIDEIDDFARLDVYPQQLVWHGENKSLEDNVIFTDSSFFKLFTIPLIYGDANHALSRPNSVVITRKKAMQYFGTVNAVGQLLEFNSPGNYYKVTGVMEEFPENAHFFADFLLSMSNLEESRSENWLTNSIYSYLLLKENADPLQVEKKMNRMLMNQVMRQLQDISDISLEEWIAGGNEFGVFLQPITNIHLNPDIEHGEENCIRPVNDRVYIYVFALIAIFILAIGAINFMNLSTARSALRAREIAMRKVVGSKRSIVILQFLTESVILSLLALILALVLVELTLPYFNQSMGLVLDFNSLGRGVILSGVLVLTLLVGLFSGAYPAIYLSQYDALQGLRGGMLKGRRSSNFRSILVVLQFTISISIIIGTMVITRQVNYLVDMDPGFEDERIVVIDRAFPLGGRIESFIQEVEKIPGVMKATNSSTYLGFSNLTSSIQLEGENLSSGIMFDMNLVDSDFLKAYGLELADSRSRFFDPSDLSDTNSVLINETAVKEYKLKDPLNTRFVSPNPDGEQEVYQVIGVVKDFHHSSLRENITPYMFAYKTASNSQPGYISIRFENKSIYNWNTLKKINELWNEFTGDEPFEYFFLSDELNKYYREEERTGKITRLFSILAMVIACLGLFGLTMFNTERRLRELAIRKAMGASLVDLLMIISREVILLLAISISLSWVISYVFLNNWLQVFPYNIGFTPGIYILAALVGFSIAMVTVNVITLRAARSNPVDALYHE